MEVVILLVLLVSWLEYDPDPSPEYNFLDYYAGKGRLSQMAEGAGYSAVGYDLDYGASRAALKGKRSSMDINSNAGLVCLGLMWRLFQFFPDACMHM